MTPIEKKLDETLRLDGEEKPVGRAVGLLLEDAAAAGVSDIHLTPAPEGLKIHYRLDGVLLPMGCIDPARSDQFLRKVKVLAGLLTYKTDIAQDGQISSEKYSGATDIRASFFPTIHGEKAVLRFFLHGTEKFDLDYLGFPPRIIAGLQEAVARPDGVVLMTGPSGSGKTTTIYSLLHEILRPGGEVTRHVVTIEDPVEHEIPGITQTQVNPEVGLTFGYSLRSLLRQDPQVIMVGEIRDRETARVAMEAGLTGHLVISTIHAGTASGVVVRLLEMGVEPHVLTASLSCVLAQRLVREVCPGGKEGCEKCHATGYRGRTVFGELLHCSDPLREAIAGRASRGTMEEIAVSGGMVPLRAEGERLLREGVTSAAEILRVLG